MTYKQMADTIEVLPKRFHMDREARHMTFRDVKKETGISIGMLSDFEKGKKKLCADNIVIILRWMAGNS